MSLLSHSSRLLLLASLIVSYELVLSVGHAQESPPPAVDHDGSNDGGIAQNESVLEDSTIVRSDVDTFRASTRRVRDFLVGTLDVGVNSATLFDIDIADDNAVRVEAERLRGVIARAERPPETTSLPAAAKARGTGRNKRRPPNPPEPETAEASPELQPAPPDPATFAARVDLDRARLDFYSLPTDRRDALVHQHAKRQLADQKAHAVDGLTEAERRAQEAEAARQHAIEAARLAQSEAERLVEEERAHLLAVSGAQADFEAGLARSRVALDQRGEETLAFRRRVRETLALRDSDSTAADRLYGELRTFLRASRNEFDGAISDIFSESELPARDKDQLGDLPDGIDRIDIDKLAAEVKATQERLIVVETVYRRDRASQLYGEVKALNVDRLSLLGRLSPSKRRTITGLTYGGFDQAGAELRQVTLVLRYHLAAGRLWAEELLGFTPQRSGSAFTTGFTAFKWLLLLAAFWWWHRRSEPIITAWRERLQEEERRARATEPSYLFRILRFLQRTRRPLEWLLFLLLLVWLLPEGSSTHLEIRLATTIFTWVLGGSFVVSTIDTLARVRTSAYGRAVATTTDEVRLRSLRLAGRTVVFLGLILALSAQLVGKGTIYKWSLSVCWLAALPVILIIIRWWRNIIFERVVAVRKKKTYHRWVEAHQKGWRSFPAAVSAGVYLFLVGGLKATRNWLTDFDLTRRGLAYLFRRGMDRLAEDNKTTLVLKPIPEDLFTALGPETISDDDISGSGDEDLNNVVKRISSKGGGVFAVVGERGRGKTTVLRRVSKARQDIVLVDCPGTELEGLRQAIANAMGMDDSSTLDDCASQMDAPDRDASLLIDHAHRLINPVMGGLAEFDQLIQAARAHSARCTWILALNEVIWQFLERARGARPLFDDVVRLEPWREEEISGLLTSRCAQTGIAPSFEHVIEKLPPDADEIDREEALKRVTHGYYRMIWDYSVGNAGVALHTWRRSLGVDAEGRICVRLFRVPDTRELEELPEHTAFVFRAVIQLEPALAVDVVRATPLSPQQVEDLLRYGVTHGYFQHVEGHYRVTWAWFRPITRFLQRRHLLADLS